MKRLLSLNKGSTRISAGRPAKLTECDLLPFQLETVSGLLNPNEHGPIIQAFTSAVEDQLHLLRRLLGATTVVLLWRLPGESLPWFLYRSASLAGNLHPGPFDAAQGILGALKNSQEIILPNYRDNSPQLPYYRKNSSVGSFYARLLQDPTANTEPGFALLCIDRECSGDWTATARTDISLVCGQLVRHYQQTCEHLLSVFERRILNQSFSGLKLLNSSLDLNSVCAAAVLAIASIVPEGLVMISTIEGGSQRVRHVSDPAWSGLIGEDFPLADSLIGQAVKYRQSFYRTAAAGPQIAIVAGQPGFAEFAAVFVVPLYQEQEPVSAVMLVAVAAEGQLTPYERDMVQLIAAQVAIRVQLAEAHEQISQLSLTDPLTGIANRRAFERGLSSMRERAQRRNSPFSLVIGDIDHFKRINDNYGHPCGDQVIQQVAEQLRTVVRSGDLAARIGGEEFAILLEDTDRDGAFRVAERLRRQVAGLRLYSAGQAVAVTISLGLVVFPEDSDKADNLLSRADQALYRAKQQGRNCCVCWGAEA